MDFVDGSDESSKIYRVPQKNSSHASIMNIGSGVRDSLETKWSFNKTFHIAFQSHLLEYTKSEASEYLMHGECNVKAYIHSLPWEKLYFYMTENEYNTVINSFHSASVESVNVKIYNLGVSTQLLQGTSSVSFKTISSNHCLGIWRGFEKHGPVKNGSSITPEFLYGPSVFDLDKSVNCYKCVDSKDIGAVCQMKYVDNRIVYKYITSKYNKEKKEIIKLQESKTYLPPLFDMATVTVDANSVGLIYETTYRPLDGMLHDRSYDFHNSAVVQHKPHDVNTDLADEANISDATYVIADDEATSEPCISYKDATIDNMCFSSLRPTSKLGFVDGLGIGVLPQTSTDGSNVDANLNIAIHTQINIKAQALGGRILSNGVSRTTQANPNSFFFVHKNKKF